MNILLIKPKWFFPGGAYKFSATSRIAPLNLGIIAALSSTNGNNIKIIDEDVENIPDIISADLVGMTVATFTAPRAYLIAKRFKEKDAKIVMGGVHPSLMPKECLKFADAVVIGEAEYVWPKILDDFKSRQLKEIYNSGQPTNMRDVPFPRRDLFSKKYVFSAIQATRGCVNGCAFCYLKDVPWGKYRFRKPASICEELRKIKNKLVIFVDDNLFVNENYVIELMEYIRPLKLLWGVQAPVSIAQNDKLLRKIADAGCFTVSFGFQSINQDSLDYMSVRQQADEYEEVVSKLHQYGIMVQGMFMLGFDFDTEENLRKMFKVIQEIDLDDALFYILTPYPGTRLYNELNRENRIVCHDLSRYSWNNCVFQPKNMSPRELELILRDGYKEITDFQRKSALRKIIKNWKWGIKFPRVAFHLLSNALKGTDNSRLP